MSFNLFKQSPTVGFALGGGGPKGLAHIGVIKKCEEHHIPIDYIAGTSAGAIVGAFYAKSKNIAEVEEYIVKKNWWEVLSLLADPSLVQGILQGRKAQVFVEGYLGTSLQFDQLSLPFSAISVDLATGQSVMISEGPVSKAVMASFAIPMLFKPVNIDGKCLIDGGVTSPVPVEAVKKMGADITVGVNLNKHYFSENVSDKLNLFQVARHAFSIMTHNIALYEVKKADIVINPRVDEIHWKTLLDEGQKIKAIHTGELAAEEEMPSLKVLIEAGGQFVPSLFKRI
ncbi:hypothetical protein COY90_00895, partial [Candidatus Roizmanbacteria bacterium CG_4_10_14_0_8_um_filter_39_9]